MTDTTTAGTSTGLPTLQEYRLELRGRLIRVVRDSSIRLVFGCLLAFVVVLVSGMAAEEDVFSDAAGAWMGQFTRLAVGLTAGVGVVLGLCACLADGLLSVAMSHTLVDAAKREAQPTCVPAPEQDQRVADAPFGGLVVFLGFALGFDALALIAAVYLPFERGIGWPWVLFTLAIVAIAVCSVVAIRYVVKVVRPRHLDRKSVIYGHWNKDARSAAQQRVHDVLGGKYKTPKQQREQGKHASKKGTSGKRRSRGPVEWVGAVVTWLGVAGLLVAFVLAMVVVGFRRPGGRFSIGESDRVYSQPVEQMLSDIFTVVVAVALPAGCLGAVGILIVTCVRRMEWRTLRAAAADPASAKPAHRILAAHAHAAGRIGHLLGVLAAGALMLGCPALIMTGGDAAWLNDYQRELAGLVAGACVVFAIGIVFEARARESDRGTRNRIAARWSTWLPPQS